MVYSEHTPVEQKQHKNHENDQWRLLGNSCKIESLRANTKKES